MDRQPDTTFDDEDNLIARRPGIQRCADLTARAGLVEVRARAVQCEGDQLHFLARQDAAGPRVRAHAQQQFRSFGVPFLELSRDEPQGFTC